MFDGRRDQADGLRRLLAGDVQRSYALFGARPGCGATSCVMNLGAALARAGSDVLLVDEHEGATNIAGKLNVGAASASQRASAGLQVSLAPGLRLQTAYAADAGGREWSGGVVLVDALSPLSGRESRACIAAQEVLVVMQSDASSITRAYSVMKRLRMHRGIRRFRVLVSQCSDSGAARRAVHNLTQAARGFLDATLEYAGAVPLDPAFEVAERRYEPLVSCRPSSAAARVFRQLAEDILGHASRSLRDHGDNSGPALTSNHRNRRMAATGG